MVDSVRTRLDIIFPMETLYITHPACRLHDMGAWHPECPERLDAINDQMVASGLMDFVTHRNAVPATAADVLRVHRSDYLDYLCSHAPREGHFSLDPDTLMDSHTMEAAWAAAGAGLTAVDAVMQQQCSNAFCAVRPPGHHARPDQAMGFCFFNNVAVAAAYALEKYKLDRIAVIDFDVHHGNGTEEMFGFDPRVLMCSFYQHPLFPDQRQYPPPDNMLNVPVAAGSTGAALRDIVSNAWLPRLREFSPQLIFISAGFDAHREDSMGQLNMVEADYAWITEQVVALADETAQGRIISMLEGGYSLSALGRSVVAHIKALSKL